LGGPEGRRIGESKSCWENNNKGETYGKGREEKKKKDTLPTPLLHGVCWSGGSKTIKKGRTKGLRISNQPGGLES